jgi:S-adenosylmethionine-dependent methyltransferase
MHSTDPKLFDEVEVRERYLAHYGTIRGKVRMEIVRQHLGEVILRGSNSVRVLDIGCGDGRDSTWLANLGHEVVAFDTSEGMLSAAEERLKEETGRREAVRLCKGGVDDALSIYGTQSFDLVLSHGVIMYQRDPSPFVARHMALVKPGGTLSLLAKNADGMAFRAARESSVEEAIQWLDDSGSLGHLGVKTSAQSIQEITHIAREAGATVRSWAGVRVFTDTPSGPVLNADQQKVIELEWRAAQRDPHRHMAALLHVLLFRPSLADRRTRRGWSWARPWRWRGL